MKKGLMTQYPYARGRAFVCKNIGDYIQSVASRQYIDHVDEYIEQEEADKYYPADKEHIKLIMNGWFQWRAENWPPSEYIKPLLISMHFSPLRQEKLLTPKGIEFLKKHSPVGCRDYYTVNLLKSKGIDAYFSACVTLTLGKKYYVDKNQRNGVCFVDPYFDIPPLYDENKTINEELLNQFISFYSLHSDVINSLAKKDFFKKYSPTGFLDRDANEYRPFYKAACFYKEYSKKFSDKLLLEAEYITHWLDVDMAKDSNDDLLNYAEKLVKKYASAKLVITSRTHAGLPSLGLRTPVIFIANEEVVSENGNFNTPGRLDGLIDFFRIFTISNGDFTTNDAVLTNINKVDEETTFANKTEWEYYAKKLDIALTKFMSD